MSDILELEARLKNYISGEVGVIVNSLDKFSGKMGETAQRNVKASNEMERSMSDLKSSWDLGKIALGSLVGAMGAMSIVNNVTGFLKSARAEYQENVAVQLKLTTALGYTSKALNDQASALSQKLVVDDDEIIKVQAMLANYVKSADQIERLTPAVLDLAAAIGTDMVSAANIVAKSIIDDNGELGKFKIKIDGAAGSVERIDSVLNGINQRFKGQAEAVAQAKDGWDAFGVTFKDILQSVGRSDLLQSAGEAFNQWAKGVKIIVDSVFQETVTASQGAVNQLNTISNQATIITGVWKDRQKIFDQVSMLTHGGRMAMYARQYRELHAQAIAAHDLIAADSINLLYYGTNGIIPKEKQAEQERLNNIKEANRKRSEEALKAILPNRQTMEKGQEDQKQQEIDKINALITKENALARTRQTNINNELKAKKVVEKQEERAAANKLDTIDYQTNYMIGSIKTMAQASNASSKVQKGIDIAQATANTALAVTKSLATPWMIPFILLTGMAQVALISQQKYAGGGLVGGGSPTQGDVVPAMLTPGEMVLNGQQQANLFNQLNRPNVSNNSAVNLHINVGNGGTYDMNAARYTVDQLVPILGDALVRAKSQGRLRDYENAR